MRLIHKPKPRLLAVMMAAIVVTGGIPFVVGDHINDMLTPWREVTDEPTGNSLLDSALGAASEVLDEQVGQRREEPQLPATFYHDWFPEEPTDRIGGHGDWHERVGEENWNLSSDAAGQQVQAFGVPADGVPYSAQQQRDHIERGHRFGGTVGYPAPPPPSVGGSFQLASPLISLQSLPVDIAGETTDVTAFLAGDAADPVGDAWRTVCATDDVILGEPGNTLQNICPPSGGVTTIANPNTALNASHAAVGAGPSALHRVLLYVDHRFNLACGTVDANTDGFCDDADGAAVLVLPEGRNVATPVAPLRTAHYDPNRNITIGQQVNFTEEAYDLTPWAGQDIHLVFQINASGDPDRQARPSLFEQGCAPLCGWDISNLRIEGPAHQHNVRLDRIFYPLPDPDPDPDPDDADQHVARPGDDPFSILLLNRGQMTEQVEVRFKATWEEDGAPRSAECPIRIDDLVPGDAVPLEFSRAAAGDECSQLRVEDGQRYNVSFEAEIDGADDHYTTDNRIDIRLRGDGPDISVTGLDRNTDVFAPDGTVDITATLYNQAITDGAAEARLRIDYRNATGDVFEEGVQHNKSLIRFEPGVDANQTVQVPQREHVDATWGFRLQEVGCYRVFVDAYDPATEALLPPVDPGFALAVGVKEKPDSSGFDCGSDYDLQLYDVSVSADYDWQNLGFGPDTEATAHVTLQNNGFFPIEEARVALTIQNETGATWVHNVTMPTGFSLESGDPHPPVDIPFEFPAQDGRYRLVFSADLLGELVPGLPLEDNDASNDCHVMAATGQTHAIDRVPGEPCPLASAANVVVRSAPALSIDIQVSPEAGRTGEAFPRDLDVQVINAGNVEVEDALLTLLIQHAHEDPVPDQASGWIIEESPKPGHAQSWAEMVLRNPLDPALNKTIESQITLPRDGMYFVTAFLHLDGVDAFAAGEREDVRVQLRLDAFDTIYSDTFERQGVDIDFPDLVAGEEMIPRNDTWQLGRGEVPDPLGGVREQAMWQFGDPQTGQYPDDEDAVLELPAMRLSSARRAMLALSHNYQLEDGYDGARLEASVDGGDTWVLLKPQQGYSGTVGADSPFNAERDPTATTPAFTGDSHARSETGWVTDEFDLAELPDFLSPVQLVRFNQEGFDTGPHDGDVPVSRSDEDGRITSHPHWALPQRDCSALPLQDCWYRENVNWHNPLPLCDARAHVQQQLPSRLEKTCKERIDHDYWWSGSAEDGYFGSGNSPATSLSYEITIDAEDIKEGEEARIAFWYWKDNGGVLFGAEMPNGFSNCDAEKPSQGGSPCQNWQGEHRYRDGNKRNSDFRFGEKQGTKAWQQGAFVIPDAHQRLGGDGSLTVTVRIVYLEQVEHYFSISGAGCSCGGWGPVNKPFSVANRGAAIDNVELQVVDASGAILSRELVSDDHSESSFATGNWSTIPGANVFATNRGESWTPNDRQRWAPHTQESFCDDFEGLCTRDNDDNIVEVNFGWSRVDKAAVTNEGSCSEALACEAWGIKELLSHRNEHAPVWQFGAEVTLDDGTLITTYPANAHQRLVTPLVDLSGVAGGSANLTFWERYEMMHDILGFSQNTRVVDDTDRRNILIQVVEPTPEGGERISEWKPLQYQHAADVRSETGDRDDCTQDSPAWCPTKLDLSDFIGQKVRFAFDIKTSRLAPEPDPDEQAIGWTWLVNEVGIEAQSMVGETVHLRLRAATDGSISQGHWQVQNIQLVGKLYGDNVAIQPDEPLRDQKLAGGETMVLDGTIRNLGSVPHSGRFLDLSVVAVGDDEAPNPSVTFLRDNKGEKTDPAEGPLGPIGLNRVGSTNLTGHPMDRIPYAIEVELPPDAPEGTNYRFTLRLVDAGGVVLVDDNLGDHERVFDVIIDSEGVRPSGELQVHPPTVAVGENARFALSLENTGPKSVVVDERAGNGITVTVERLDDAGEPVTIRDDLLVTVPAGGEDRLEWSWSPSEPGFYRIHATVKPDGVGESHFYSHLLVGSKPIYYLEDFASDPFADGDGAWVRSASGWTHSSVFHDQGGGSLFVGNDQGFTYPGTDTRAQMPWQDLSFLGVDQGGGEKAILEGDSPFSPHLSMKYMSILNPGHAVAVRGDRDDDSLGYRDLRTQDTHTHRTGSEGLTGRDDVNWKVASYPLFDGSGSNSVLDSGANLLGNHNVSFEFHAAWPGGSGRGQAIDLITISSYDVQVEPARHDVVLRPGSDKTFHFRVENTGAADDTYKVRIRDDAGNLLLQPSLATVGIPEASRELTLAPGESALASVHVAIPFERYEDDFFSGSDLVVEVVSTEDPNRVATGIIRVDDFIGDKLPDLVTDLGRPSGETGPVGEAEQANFVISIANEGTLASRATDVVLFACPKTFINETDEVVAVESIGHCGELGLAKSLAEMRMPPLLPSQDMEEGQTDDVWATTVSWIPEVLKDRGDYWIVAVADPRGEVPQFSRDSAVDKLDLTVAPFEQPDLHVTDLRVTNANGNPVTSAFAGDTLHIEGTVRNDGDATAPNVRLRILNQFALRDERIGDLHPGGSHTLEAQWVAKPGNWVVRLEASTGVVETSTDNNAEAWSLAIRSGTLEAKWDPGILHLDPGKNTGGTLHLHNQRDHAMDLIVEATAGDIGVQGLADVQVPRGASREMPVVLTASPFAEAGMHPVRVDLVQRDTGTLLASATLEVHVGAQRSLRMVADPLSTPPGTAQLHLLLRNDGTGPEDVTVHLEAPEGWTATAAPPNLRLEPGSPRTVQGVLEIPAGTPAGRYQVAVEAGEIRQNVAVDVVPQAVWRSELTAVNRVAGNEALVRVENVGNMPAVPTFATGEESEFSVDPVPSLHEPGEARSYRILVDSRTSSLRLPGQDTPVPLQASGVPPAVEAVRLAVQSAGAVTSGEQVDMRLAVRSVGSESQQALPVRLWVDGKLAVEQRIDLAAGEARDVDFKWRFSDHGPLVVSATVGSSEGSVARTVVIDVAPEARALAIPAAAPTVLVLVLAVAAVWRKRET